MQRLPSPRDMPRTEGVLTVALDRILGCCDWYSLMATSRANRRMRAAVRLQVRRRMETIVVPFIPFGTLNGFIHMLDDTGAAVVGSVCRRLLASGSDFTRAREDGDVTDQSFDLNILVREGSFDQCVRWFASQGYTMGGGGVDWPYGRAVSEVVNAYVHSGYGNMFESAGWRPYFMSNMYHVSAYFVGEACPYLHGKTVRVTISKVRASIVEAILSAPLSAQVNAFTSTRIYSFFPTLVTKDFSLASHLFEGRYNPVHPSYKISESSNSAWYQCGFYCPNRERKSIGDPGAASFFWNPHYMIPPSSHATTDSLLAENIITWRFSDRCANTRCDNYTPEDASNFVFVC